MRTKLITVGCLFLLVAAGALCRAEVNAGITINEDGIEGFYLAISSHFQVPEKEVVVVREKRIPEEEMPVVFFLAGRAGIAPEAIIKMRLGGKTWMDISFHYGLTAEAFYVPVTRDPGPPYGKAYGHFKKHDRKKWGTIRLADEDIINLVNLRFISEHYGCSADEVVKMRSEGRNFVNIHSAVKKNKGKSKKQAVSVADNQDPPAKKPGKGKGRK